MSGATADEWPLTAASDEVPLVEEDAAPSAELPGMEGDKVDWTMVRSRSGALAAEEEAEELARREGDRASEVESDALRFLLAGWSSSLLGSATLASSRAGEPVDSRRRRRLRAEGCGSAAEEGGEEMVSRREGGRVDVGGCWLVREGALGCALEGLGALRLGCGLDDADEGGKGWLAR